MTLEEMRNLARHAANRTAPAEFSVSSVDAALADGFKNLCGSINNFMRNRYDIYDIIIENADTIVPAKVMDAMGQFAEIIQLKNGEKKMFKRGGLGRNRAKKFLTQVGLNGLYETFRLDHETFSIGMKAVGGAVTIDFQRLIDGSENLAEFMSVLAEAQEDAIYAEVQNALMAAAANMPARNKVLGNGFDAAAMVGIINTVKTYGGGATIFASPEFIAAMGPDAIVPGTGTTQGVYHPDDLDAIHLNGRIRIFRGTPVVELRQSFLDEKNEQKMINPQYAYILPTGQEKVVKVCLEGDTQVREFQNPDGSLEIHSYKMIGVGILAFNNWGIYQNKDISVDDWYNADVRGLDIHKA